MSSYDEITVAVAVQAFLDALARDSRLLVAYVHHRADAIRGWFDDQPTFADVREEAEGLLVAGNFLAVKELLGPPDVEAQRSLSTAQNWVTIWIV